MQTRYVVIVLRDKEQMQKGIKLIEAGLFQDAVEEFQTYLERNPDSIDSRACLESCRWAIASAGI